MVGHSVYSLTLIYMLNYCKKKSGGFGGRGIEGALFYSLVFCGPQLLFQKAKPCLAEVSVLVCLVGRPEYN